MADTSRRLGLHAPTGGDPADVPADIRRLRDQLDGVVAAYAQGGLAARPRAGVEGRQYYATDDGNLYYDTGTAWVTAMWQPGDIRWTARADTAPGWLRCDGVEYDRDEYRALFNAIGVTFGNGSRPNSFRVPDLVGRTIVGPDPRATRLWEYWNLGQGSGRSRHQLAFEEMPRHSHAVPELRESWLTMATGSLSAPQPDGTYGTNLTTSVTSAAGNNLPHNNMPPYLVCNAWVKF